MSKTLIVNLFGVPGGWQKHGRRIYLLLHKNGRS